MHIVLLLSSGIIGSSSSSSLCWFRAAGRLGLHGSPLMFYSDDAIQEAACSSSSGGGGGVNHRSSSSCSCRPRGGPLSVIFSSFFNCWLPGLHDSSSSSLESKASWAKITRADALLELSKRQQSALMDKQEAIELLERKLQQLQSESMKPPELLQLQQAGKQSHSKLLTQGIADDDHHQKLLLQNFEIPDSTTASSDQTSTSSSSSYRFPESTSTEDHSPQAAAAAAIRRTQQEATAAAAAASSCISSVNTKEASAKENISSSVQEDEDKETKEFSAEERSPSQGDHETKAFSAKERSSRSSSQEEDHLESRAFPAKERSSRSSLQEDHQETKAFSTMEKSSRSSLQEDQQVPKTFSAKEKSSRDSLQKEDEEIKAFSAKERSSRSLIQEDGEETTKAFSAMERSSRSWLQEDSAGREVQNAAGTGADHQVLQIPTWNPSSGLECISLTEKEHLFEMGVMRARVAVRYFCKLFMKQMEISGYSVWRTLQALDPDATFAKQEHTAYALESNLNKAIIYLFFLSFHCWAVFFFF